MNAEIPAHTPHRNAPTPELERLLSALHGFAIQQLERVGGFEPFGASLRKSGDLVFAGAALEESAEPMDTLMAVFEGLKAQAHQGLLHSAGYCMGVRIEPPGQRAKVSAIQVCLEDSLGHSMEVFFPYQRTEDSRIVYGSPFSGPDDLRIFYEAGSAA